MGNKQVIAFFISNLENKIGNAMLKGALDKAISEKINLVLYIGGNLGEGIRSVIYEMFNPDWIQGIISWASSRQYTNPDLFNLYKSMPVVTLSVPQSGIPVIMADTYQGMKEVVEHFIIVHKFTKIAFIRGPETHNYAQTRYQAYVDTLREHNIPLDKNLVTPPGTWSREWGIASIRLFLQDRGLKPGKDIEAIVGVSDVVSVPAMKKLQKMGVNVPQDIAISGYNDSIEARCSIPSLTTVAIPFMEQGRIAINMIKNMLKNEQVQQEVLLPSKMVLGQSCGCYSPAVKSVALRIIPEITRDDGFLQWRILKKKNRKQPVTQEWNGKRADAVISAMADTVVNLIDREKITIDFIKNESRALLAAFSRELNQGIPGLFLNTLSEILKKTADREGKVEIWHPVISVMQNSILSDIKENTSFFKTEALWQQARIIIGEISERIKESFHLKRTNLENTLRDIGMKLITTFDINKLMDILAESLPLLDIPGCYLALYEKSDKAVPEWAKLILAYTEKGRITLDGMGMRFKARDLLPGELLPQNRSYAFIVEPLHFQEELLGHVVFEAGPEEGSVYFSLKYQLSSALYGALVLRTRTRAKSYLQETLHKMHDKAQVVTDSSMNISAHVNDISASMEEVAASVQEISRHIGMVMDSVNNAVSIARDASLDITDLSEHSRKIGEIVDIINDIADQTNILALNAAIEAAHAGSAGRGFDVVAREIKKLARKTVLSIDEINQMIKITQINTDKTAGAINSLVDIIHQISDLSHTITTAIDQQAGAASEISNLLIEAAGGSRNISNAISEVASLGDDLDI